MKGLAFSGLVAIMVVFAACGGGGQEQASGSGTQPRAPETQTSMGIPACWREVAETYRSTSTRAFAVLGDDVPDLVEQYEALVAADAGSDEAAFRRAYDRLFDTLNRSARHAEAFLAADAQAQDVLVDCNAEAGDETADPCWNKVALAHQAASDQARVTLGRHLQRMFDAFNMIFSAAARDDDAAVAAGNRRLAAALEAITPEARAYARKQGTAEQVYTACAGAA